MKTMMMKLASVNRLCLFSTFARIAQKNGYVLTTNQQENKGDIGW